MTEKLTAEQSLEQKGFFATTVNGVSMRPMLKGREDTVLIVPITAPLRKYDVVLFRREGQLVLHRIIAIRDGQYRIRGDNCVGYDTVAPRQILGIMTQFTRKGKPVSADDRLYRLYARLWVGLHGARLLWLRIKHFAGRITK